MKLIIAIIRENQLDQVRESLIDHEISRITVGRVSGHGRLMEDEEIYRGRKIIPNLSPNMRIEIAVNDDFVEPAVKAIVEAADSHEEMIGGGKIFVLPLENVIRVRTGEEGPDAI